MSEGKGSWRVERGESAGVGTEHSGFKERRGPRTKESSVIASSGENERVATVFRSEGCGCLGGLGEPWNCMRKFAHFSGGVAP